MVICRFLIAAFALSLAATSAIGCGSGGGPSAETSKDLRAGISGYQAYLEKSSAKLTHWADTIVLKVAEGSVPKAGSRYAASRVPYGHIDVAAQLLGRLDTRTIERALFKEGTTASMKPAAKRLRIEAEELEGKIAGAKLQADQIIAGANKVLAEISSSDVVGKAEPYAHNDLVDIAAKIEGVEAALEAVHPLLAEKDPQLSAEIKTQLGKVYAELEKWGILARNPEQARPREPGIAFVVYNDISHQERREVAAPIEALAALVAQA